MMITVMIIAILTIKIAKDVHINKKNENGLRYGHFM